MTEQLPSFVLPLQRVGELLAARGERFRIVIVGGAALQLLGLVDRATTDVDIIAFAGTDAPSRKLERPPDPLPASLRRAAETVASDLGLRTDWLNAQTAMQWDFGMPPHLDDEIRWYDFGGLEVGAVGRLGLIHLKLFAAVDGGPAGVHFQDLLVLKPMEHELDLARRWVETQDASPDFARLLEEVVRRATRNPG